MFRFEEGYDANKKLLQENNFPPSELQRLKDNMVHYENKMKEINQQKAAWEKQQKQQKQQTPDIKTKTYKKKKKVRS